MGNGDYFPTGSFAYSGVNLVYTYDTREGVLLALHLTSRIPVFRLLVASARESYALVETLEKILKIFALKFSNHQSADLAEVFDGTRFAALVQNCLQTARYARGLHAGNMGMLHDAMSTQCMATKIDIRHTPATADAPARNFLGITLKNGENFSVYSPTLHGVLARMAEQISLNLIDGRFSPEAEQRAQKRLKLAAMLSTLSLALNPDYEPQVRARIVPMVLAVGALPADSEIRSES